MTDLDREKGKWIDSVMVILFFAGVLLFLVCTGTLDSGYHFIDDHEMLEMHQDLGNMSVFETSLKWIKRDFDIRFRPMYFLHRILEMKIFGSDFFSLSFYTSLLAAVTFSLFYLGSRKLRFSVLESLVLVLLTFVGPQMAVWWKLGSNETIGMVMLGVAYFFMARCTSGKQYFLNSMLFNLFLIAASLSKESFVIVIPAFVVYKVWEESRVFKISFKESAQKNYLLAFSLLAMVAELWLIFFVVGTNKIGYAGTPSSAKELLLGIKNTLVRKDMLGEWVKLITAVAVIFLFQIVSQGFSNKASKRNPWTEAFSALIFSFLIVFPNLVLNAKTGMVERYLLPSTFGLAFLVVVLIKNAKTSVLRWTIVFACAIFLFFSFEVARKSAVAFTEEGIRTNKLLSAVLKYAGPESKILLVVDPVDRFEVSDSFRIYLSYNGFNNLYVFPVKRDYRSDFERGLEKTWEKWFEGRGIENIGSLPDEIVLIDKNQEKNFFSQSGIPKCYYDNVLEESNPHLLLVRK